MSIAPDGRARPDSGSRNLLTRIGAAIVLIPLAIAAAYLGGWVWAALVVPVAIGLFVEWLLIVRTATDRARTGWIGLGAMYAGTALIGSILVRRDAEYGFVSLLLVLAVVWASDIGGYFAGKGIGGPKLAPRISPNKTWAGAIGGFVLSLLVAVGFAASGQGRLLPMLVLAAALSVVSQAGDLFESAVKRRFGVKDSSNVIPGHGGLLDRLDGFVAAIAFAALVGFLRGGADGVGRGLMVW